MGFVFYDTETTGTHTCFDQILQFAAIQTDDDLNELERFEIRCRLMPHVIPSPGALCVTRISIDRIIDPALPTNYEMVCLIREKLASWSPSVFTGWNTLKFDEHMLRQAFYQNLHPVYLTNTGGNCRIDILKLAQSLPLLQPDALVVPLGDNGKPSFKLDRLAPANGFHHANAHDALADVEATIHVARMIRQRAPDVWAQALRFSNKAAVAETLEIEPALLLTESYFNRPHQFAVTKIGHESGNPSNVLVLDLTIEPDQLRMMTDQELAARLSRSPKPVRRVKTNAAPTLQSLTHGGGFNGFSANELLERAGLLKTDPEFLARLIRLSAPEEWPEPEHVEEQIYSGFVSRADERRMGEFHRLPWEERVPIIDQFTDARLTQLARRLVFEHRPDLIPEGVRMSLTRKRAHRISGHGILEPAWTTIAAAQKEAEARREGCTPDEAELLYGISAFLADRADDAARWH